MSEEEQPAPETAAERLAVKLQALFDALPEDEQALMARLVQLALEGGDVEGYGAPLQRSASLPESESPNPIDDFRANLGLYLRPDD